MSKSTAKVITELGNYFKPFELVDKNVFDRYGNDIWRFFDIQFLETLLVLRKDILKVPLVCNNWKSGGTLSQRGLRENIAPLVWSKTNAGVMYLSAHTLGKAVDLSSGKMTADEMRSVIREKQSLLPYKVRIEAAESAPTWLHIDTMCSLSQKDKIVWFK